MNWCIAKGVLQKIDDQLDAERFTTYADLIRFVVKYHSEVNNKTFKTDANNNILPYLEYAVQNEIIDWRITFDGNVNATDYQTELEEPINTLSFVSALYSAIPNLKLEITHKADQLSTINTQDDVGQYILKLCNAGILEESNQVYHWNRVLTRAEFANIVDRIYNPQKRRIRLINEPTSYVIKEMNVSLKKYNIRDVYGNIAIINDNESKECALFDANKNEIIFQGYGSISVLEEGMFAFYSDTSTLIIDSSGEVVFNKPVYLVTNFANGYCVVGYPNDDHLYFINKKGQEINKYYFSKKDELKWESVNLVYYFVTGAAYYSGSDDTLKLYDYENGEFINFNHMYARYLPNGKIFAIKKEPFKMTVINKDLSPIVHTDYENLEILNDEYYMMESKDSEDMKKEISILNQSGEVVLTHTIGSEDYFGNIATDAILIKEKEDYAYTYINLTTLSKESFYVMGINFSEFNRLAYNNWGSAIDSHGRSITPTDAYIHNTSFYNDVLKKYLTTFFYEYNDRLYYITPNK